MAEGYNPQPFNLDYKETLGSLQGTGTATLSHPITDYKFLCILVGFYSSGFTCYGMLTIPVIMVPIETSPIYNITIPFYDTSAGRIEIGFNSATELRVSTSTNPNYYVSIRGIR